MNVRLVAFIICATALTPGSVRAQVTSAPSTSVAAQYIDLANGWSIDDAIARAIAQEAALRAARTYVEAARGMRVQAGLRPNPSVSLERRDEPGGTDNQTMASVQWPLDLFRRASRVTVAEREINATQLEVRDRERLLAADVRVAYGAVLTALRHLGILDSLVDATTVQHQLLGARVDEGAATPLERDLLTIELRRLESERLLQTGRVEAAVFELKRVVGIPAEVPITVRDDLESIMHRDLTMPPGLPATGLTQRADVLAAEARVGVAEARIDLAQRQGRFDMTLLASYMRMDAGFPQHGFASDGILERVRGVFQYFSGGVMVTMPLFNRNQGEVATAQAERNGAVARLDAARIAMGNELAAAHARDLHAQRAVHVFSGGALALGRQNLAVVTEAYTVGRITVFDVLAEQRRYLELERAYTEALSAAFDARTALRRAVGDVQ